MCHDPAQVKRVLGAVQAGARLDLSLRDLVRQFPLKSEFTWSDAYPPHRGTPWKAFTKAGAV